MKHKNILSSFALLALALSAPVALGAGDDAAADHAVIEAQRYSYPLSKCPVSGKAFDEATPSMAMVHEGRMYLTCSEACKAKIVADPAKYAAMVEKAVIEQQLPSYPLDMCVVSSEGLEDMGKPVDLVHGTRLVRLCCKSCKKAFAKDPAVFLAKIDEKLIAAQTKDYPLETCVVSNEGLDSMGEPVDKLYGVTLVRFCCKGCVKTFEKKPDGFLARIRAARASNG